MPLTSYTVSAFVGGQQHTHCISAPDVFRALNQFAARVPGLTEHVVDAYVRGSPEARHFVKDAVFGSWKEAQS